MPTGLGLRCGWVLHAKSHPKEGSRLGLEVARLHSQGTSPKDMPIAGCIYGQPNYTVAAFVLWVAKGWPNAIKDIQNFPGQRLEKGT